MRFSWKATSAVAGVLMILAACSGDVPTGDPSPTPEFTGPYRGQFIAADSHVRTPLAHQVLADSDITPDEMAQVNAVFTACLEDLGLTQILIGQVGGVQYAYPLDVVSPERRGQLDRGELGCEADTDWGVVSSLYAMIRFSPDGGDMSGAIADCLVRAGLRPEGYSAEDYRIEYDAPDSFSDMGAPNTPTYAKFYACVTEPLHAP